MAGALKSTHSDHVATANICKKLREEAGFNQSELASRLQVCRETIVAIENCHLRTMQTLEADFVKKLWKATRPTAKLTTKEEFKSLILRWFNF